MPNAHDVVVVGAGPAGSAAAAGLARRGFDVLILDREPFPRDKTCGDGIPPGSMETLNKLGMGDKLAAARFHRVRALRFGSPWGRLWDATFEPARSGAEFVIAPRREFDNLLLDHARACGAEFRVASVRGLRVERGAAAGVVLDDTYGGENIRARVVIGADGATSVVGRALQRGRQPTHHRGVAIRGYLDHIDVCAHRVEFYFYKEYLPGYAWIFPLAGGGANVGVIMRADRFKKSGASLDDHLQRFLSRGHVAARIAQGTTLRDQATWQVGYATTAQVTRSFDGALLLGDAGWLVDPLWGEGIHNALTSADLATDVVAGALAAGDVSRLALAGYDRRIEEVLGPVIRRSYRIQKWITAFPAGLEAGFAMANTFRGLSRRLINRVSTDYVVGQAVE